MLVSDIPCLFMHQGISLTILIKCLKQVEDLKSNWLKKPIWFWTNQNSSMSHLKFQPLLSEYSGWAIFQILNLLALLAFCCHFHQKYVCLRKRLKYLYLSKKRNTFASEKNWNTFISEKDYLIIMSHWVKIIKPQFSSFCLISPHNRLILPHNRLILPHNCLILPHFASNRLRCCLNLPQNDSESPPRNNVMI